MPRARKNNKPATPNGNSLALDQILAKESAKRTLKTVKKQKVKCMFWLEDIALKSKYEFSSKERFESTIKRLIKMIRINDYVHRTPDYSMQLDADRALLQIS